MRIRALKLSASSAVLSTNLQKLNWRCSSMTRLNSSFKIGSVEIPHRTVLAPMAGVTNSAFRTIAKEFGAGLVVMEMISEKGLLYNRSEEHTSELQSRQYLVCRLLLEKKNNT